MSPGSVVTRTLRASFPGTVVVENTATVGAAAESRPTLAPPGIDTPARALVVPRPRGPPRDRGIAPPRVVVGPRPLPQPLACRPACRHPWTGRPRRSLRARWSRLPSATTTVPEVEGQHDLAVVDGLLQRLQALLDATRPGDLDRVHPDGISGSAPFGLTGSPTGSPSSSSRTVPMAPSSW